MKALMSIVEKVQQRFRAVYLLWGLFAAISCSFVWSASSGQQGLFSFFELKESLHRIEKENLELLEESHAFEKDIYLLRNNPGHVEKIAREEFGYISKGETLYLFQGPDGER